MRPRKAAEFIWPPVFYVGATFELIDVRRADVRREDVVCGVRLGATFVLLL